MTETEWIKMELKVNLRGVFRWFLGNVYNEEWTVEKSIENFFSIFPGLKNNAKIRESVRLIFSRVQNRKISVEIGIKEIADLFPREMRLEIDKEEE